MRPQIESLECRNLMTVSLVGGTLFIRADLPSQNSAFIYAEDDNSVVVGLNGEVSTFDADVVQKVVYEGAQGGRDIFENSTNIIPSQVTLYGSSNVFLGSWQQDTIYLFGSDNNIDGGGGGDVIIRLGSNNNISPYPDQLVI